jgi:hypothetical protein
MAAKKRKKKVRRSPEIVALRRRVLDLEADIEIHEQFIFDLRRGLETYQELFQELLDALMGREPKGKRRGRKRT